MQCHRCYTEIESRKINGIETEIIEYKCGEEMYYMHVGCVFNHHWENRRREGKNCYVCEGKNDECSLEDVKATLETVMQLKKIRLWEDLGW